MAMGCRCTTWKSRMAIGVLLSAAIGGVVAAQGCAHWIAHAIVEAPNAGRAIDAGADASEQELNRLGITRQLRANVGLPEASLSMWLIDPPQGGRNAARPRATVLVLHGLRDQKRSQVGLGQSLAAAGYRAVLVDLRGHGASSGQWLTYGAVESRDLRQVLEELDQQDLLIEPVGVVGASYGGSTAIQLAAIDARVKAIVAVAPFASMPELVPQYIKLTGFGWAVSQRTIERSIARAGELAGFDPYSASTLAAITRSRAAILLIHGEDDRHIPCEHSRRLHDAAPDRSKLLIVDDEDHDTIMSDRSGMLSREMHEWLERYLQD